MDFHLSNAFYAICLEEGSTQTVEGIRNSALENVKNGVSKTRTSISINGQSQSWAVDKSPTEILTAASRAIARYNNGLRTSTEVDFRNA